MAKLSLEEFADRINGILPAIMRSSLKQHADSFYKVKMTLPQFFIMDYLHKKGETRMTDVANAMYVTTAAMTGIVDRLTREGYAVREHDPEDRRVIKIRATPKGERVVGDIARYRRSSIMDIFGKISQKEREEYLKILAHIRDHLEEGAVVHEK